jgi:RNA recognition motif-containing protein
MHHDQEISPKPPSRIHPMNQFTDSNSTVFVGDLSEYVTEDELRSFFQGFDEITYVKIPPGKGCGFVQFIQRDAAEMAINQMQGYPIGNSRIRLSWGPVGTPYHPVAPPPQGQLVGMPPAHSYIGSGDAPVERSFPELPQKNTAANPHEESELEASHQKQKEGGTELETAEQEVQKPADGEAARKEDLEKEIAQNLARLKEAGQSAARPAATAIAELDRTKKEFDAGPAPTDEEKPENSRAPDLAIPTTSATDLTTADPWQPYNRGNIWGDIPEIERYIGSLQKSRKSNQSVLQGYSSEPAELSSPEASMAGSRDEEPLQAPLLALPSLKAAMALIQSSNQDPAPIADEGHLKRSSQDSELDQHSAGDAQISLASKADMKPAISLGSDNPTQRIAQPHEQGFGDRYEFGPSLSTAITAANAVRSGERSLDMKAPTPAGTENPELASESYNELLDNYCFVRTVQKRAAENLRKVELS